MKFEIKNRFSGEVIFSVETDSWKLAVELAIKSQANLLGANLSRANLSWANLSGANLSRADLSQANLSWANLSGANLSWANLSRANLLVADLSRANLSGANLSGANLSGADLSGAALSRANLSGADLSQANLSWANLSGANLSGANLSGADLSGANLKKIPQLNTPTINEYIAKYKIKQVGCHIFVYKGVTEKLESPTSNQKIKYTKGIHEVEYADCDVWADCSFGISLSPTKEKAKEWGSKIILVKVNIGDIVCIPIYENEKKFRVKKCEVVKILK